MGWTGRARARRLGGAAKPEEAHAMDNKANDSTATTIGIDIGKNSLHLVGLNAA